AKITAVKPTTIDTLAPKISRDSTSRPRWSVPSRYSMLPPACQAGGRNRAASEPISGSWGASALAKTATKAMPTRMNVGSMGKPSDRARAKREGSSTASVCIAMPSPLQSNARIDQGVEDVDQQVHRHDHDAAQQDHGLHDGEVAERDTLVEQPADAGPGKHGLHHHRHVDHDDEIDAGQRQHGDQRVLEGVLADDERLGQALEPGELDIFR